MSQTFQIGADRLTLLQNGVEYFPQLVTAIDAAQRSVYLETYIFAADDTGRLVSQALQRAAQRQVAVHLLLDGYGSAELPESWVEEMRRAGVAVQWFRREYGFFRLRRHRLRRMHRKLAVIDGATAFIGGINILDDIPVEAGIDAPRLDYAVCVQGPLAAEVQGAVRQLWSSVHWASLRRRLGRLRARLRRPPRADNRPSALLLRDNLRNRHKIEAAYLRAIRGAQREIVLAHAYFLPGRAVRRALLHAAQRGVRVVMLLQGRVEYRLQHHATQALYAQLLGAGIELYEYRASFLHAKVCVVDGSWATLGSSNLDPFSLWLAREANLAVRDAAFAAALRDSVLRAIATESQAVQRPPRHPFAVLMARLSYGAIRLLVGLLIRQRH
ncbi:MAG: cardiolipin synthase ClsB [Pseudomonadota bacterium]